MYQVPRRHIDEEKLQECLVTMRNNLAHKVREASSSEEEPIKIGIDHLGIEAAPAPEPLIDFES